MARQKQNPVLARLKKQADSYGDIINEINNQYREFVVGGTPDRTIRVHFPSLEVEEKINRAYSKAYGEMLEDTDLKTEEELLDIMSTRNVWTDKEEARLKVVREKLGFLTRTLTSNGETMTDKELERYTDQYTEMQEELNDLNTKRLKITQNSIESRADELKIKLQLLHCTFEVVEEDKEAPVWKDIDEVNREPKRIFMSRVLNEALTLWNGVPSNFLDDSPEVESGEIDTPSPKKRQTRSGKSQSQSGVPSVSTS